MRRIRYTLVTEGSSDRLLKYPIEWLLERLTPLDFDGLWADPRLFKREQKGLGGKLAPALKDYPCDLLFIHRDADREPRHVRVAEVEAAVASLSSPPPAVCVVPVRATEAWILFNEQALREAAGNPNGEVQLNLPPVRTLESLRNPKALLFDLLVAASGRSHRRLQRFDKFHARHRVAELIDDFSPLEELPAFQDFRRELEEILTENGWT